MKAADNLDLGDIQKSSVDLSYTQTENHFTENLPGNFATNENASNKPSTTVSAVSNDVMQSFPDAIHNKDPVVESNLLHKVTAKKIKVQENATVARSLMASIAKSGTSDRRKKRSVRKSGVAETANPADTSVAGFIKTKPKLNAEKLSTPLETVVDQIVSETNLNGVRLGKAPVTTKIRKTNAVQRKKRTKRKAKQYVLHNVQRKPVKWIYHGQFSVDPSHWARLRTSDTIDGTYPEYFIPILNNTDIGCVLKARGAYLSTLTKYFSLRFVCTNHPCERQYKVFEMGQHNFKIYRNNSDPVHIEKKSRQVRSVKRKLVTKALQNLTPSDYMMFCSNGISETLLKEGNLQDCVSTTTVSKINSEAVQLNDFDKDDIVDLLKMKVWADEQSKENDSQVDVFIRRISLDPFAVLMYSDDQLKLLHKLGQREDKLALHFDATGSLVRHSGKRIYYYAGVVRVKDRPEDTKEKARLEPLIEFVSGEHDAFNIRLKLEEFKKDYESLFPTGKWPIKYVVTDFSFAFLNAFSRAWNSMKLIEYINHTYTSIVNGQGMEYLSLNCNIQSFLELCCGHFSKMFSKDIARFFPHMDFNGQKILKEIFAGMIDMNHIDELRKVWISLSTIFFSKYVTKDVEDALEMLIQVMTPEHNADSEDTDEKETNEDADDLENQLQDDTSEFQAIYKQSLYFQDFSSKSFRPKFDMNDYKNEFYSVEFGNVFLKKYVSILCLWTCVIVGQRRSSGPVESHFNCTKKRVKQRVTQIGSIPLKCGRFCRELESYSKSTTRACLLEIPRKNNCNTQKRKLTRNEKDDDQPPTKQMRIFDASKPIMELYKAAPKPTVKTTPRSRTTPKSHTIPPNTPTGTRKLISRQKLVLDSKNEYEEDATDEPQIDNESATETWYRQRKVVTSHTAKATLKTLREDSSKIKKFLVKQKASKKVFDEVTSLKMKNFLYDDPNWHVKPQINYVVARIARKPLYKEKYMTLFSGAPLPQDLFNMIVAQLQWKYQHCQIDQYIGLAQMISKPKKVAKRTLLILLPQKLLAANIATKSFSCFDATTSSTEKSFAEFLDYIKLHNEKFTKNSIIETGWRHKEVTFAKLQEQQDAALWLLWMLKMYLEKRHPHEYRPHKFNIELQHWTLQTSTTMKNRCVVCGLTNETNSLNTSETIDWVDCLNCDRSTHLECIDKTIDDVKQATYLCVVCAANMVTVQQANDTEEVHGSPKEAPDLAVQSESSDVSTDIYDVEDVHGSPEETSDFAVQGDLSDSDASSGNYDLSDSDISIDLDDI